MMYQTPQSDRASLSDYLSAIKSRWWVVLLVAFVFALLGWWIGSSRVESFVAQSRVLVAPTPVGSIRAGQLDGVGLERESEVIRSVRIAEAVSEDVSVAPGDLLGGLAVRFIPSSDVLSLSYSSESASTAAAVVNGFAERYTDERIAAAADYYAAIIAEQEQQLEDLTAEVLGFDAQLSALDVLRDDVNSNGLLDVAERRIELSRIDADRSAIITSRNLAIGQQRTLSNAISGSRTEQQTLRAPAEVLEFAGVPNSPSSVPANVFLVGATVLGLVLGTALAFVLDRLDGTASERSDVERALGAPVMVAVPSFGLGFKRSDGLPIMLSSSKALLVVRGREAIRRLRTSLQFLGSSRGHRSIVVTSSRPGEGKSQVAANLAISIAQGGRRVALISADMRRPTVERLLGISPSEWGLSTLLSGESEGDTLIEVPGQPNLFVLPAGPIPLNPGELLSGPRMEEVVTGLEKVVDFVIFDSPPVLSTADALSIAPRVDGVLIVIDSSRTERDAVAQTRSEIEAVGGEIIGAVMNRDRRASRRFALRRDPYAYAPAQ